MKHRVFYCFGQFGASHAKRMPFNMGPPCYGRSDCVMPFQAPMNDTITERPQHVVVDKKPKRYVLFEEFKSPIFGAYKYDPILGDFVMDQSTTTPETTTMPPQTDTTEMHTTPPPMRMRAQSLSTSDIFDQPTLETITESSVDTTTVSNLITFGQFRRENDVGNNESEMSNK